ncbi:MAG TPA: hypothetical protein PLX88_07005 [Syntrophorhabdaceae bacterium]|nr:hypothetical protein [Pseudomonadota bacterium]HPH42502.1 hypothetical protein [Syntrophorhabdaceae bacterium]HPN98318.1 hypothetical protein [Syntrophorhabdaceae bacterium]HQI56606.1 hypothetical protein [Syntrophorhabdaceae bacterium]HQJ93911.1 hypothetical protein [Syntrophorhabdaceae bacterium]
MDASYIEDYIELTRKALDEHDPDKFIDLLMQRKVFLECMMKENDLIDVDEAQNYLLQETDIIERLEEERKKLLKEMDALSQSKKAVKKYSPRFPFPPMPVFFNKKG